MRPTNGKTSPAKFEPPPVQAITTSGSSPAISIWTIASWPTTVWWSRTWLSTEPRAYFVSSRVAASSTASLIAIPSDPGLSGVYREHGPPVVRGRRRARHDRGAVRLHQHPAVRLLVVAGPDHVDLDLEAEQGAGDREGGPPLAGPGLGRQALDARLGVVERLRDRRVGLVAAGRAQALVLVVDVGWRIERLLEAAGAEERAGAIEAVGIADGLRDLDLPLRAHLLSDERHREERREVVRPEGLVRARMERWWWRRREVRDDVVPGARDALLVEHDT